MIPEWFWLVVVAIFGLAIGSFLNVVIYRFNTGRSLNSRSHCLSCGRQLDWYELFPVLSYLFLRGRCRGCRSRIPWRYALVESLTAFLFVVVFMRFEDWSSLIINIALVSVLVVITVYDLYHRIIPDKLSVMVAVLSVSLILIQVSGGFDGNVLLRAFLGGVCAFALYFSLWYFSEGRAMGLGDAKLAFGLGLAVGIDGLFSLVVWSFWLGALFGIGWVLLARLSTRHRILARSVLMPRVNMKSEIPFAPFLIAAFVLVHLFGIEILPIMERMISTLV